MDAKEFRAKWRKKVVRPRCLYFKLPIRNYLMATIQNNAVSDMIVFGLDTCDYKPGDDGVTRFYIFMVHRDELDKHMEDFEIVGDANAIDV